jgi:hypothetical protein
MLQSRASVSAYFYKRIYGKLVANDPTALVFIPSTIVDSVH